MTPSEDAYETIAQLRQVIAEKDAEIERLRGRLANVTGPMAAKVGQLLELMPVPSDDYAIILGEGAPQPAPHGVQVDYSGPITVEPVPLLAPPIPSDEMQEGV